MAFAKVYAPDFNVMDPPAEIPGGWRDTFPIRFHGPDLPGGAQVEMLDVDFLDADTAFQMDNKIRDAVRQKATERGVSVALNGVVSYAPPRRL